MSSCGAKLELMDLSREKRTTWTTRRFTARRLALPCQRAVCGWGSAVTFWGNTGRWLSDTRSVRRCEALRGMEAVLEEVESARDLPEAWVRTETEPEETRSVGESSPS